MNADKMEKISIFRKGNWYDSLDLKNSYDDSNINISIAPEILMINDYKWIKSNINNFPPIQNKEDKKRILRNAIHLFSNGDVLVNGVVQSLDDFKEKLWKHSGLTYHTTQRWLKMFKDINMEKMNECQSFCKNTDEIYLVSLPANTFLTLEECINILLEDKILWIKASLREPFSAVRFVASLIQSGWPKERISLYAIERFSFHTLVKIVDKAVLFGGEIIKKTFCNNKDVLIHGPGHSCAIVDKNADISLCAKQLLEKVASNAGRFCKNVSIIACMDNALEIGTHLAASLDLIPIKVDKFSKETYIISQTWSEKEVMSYERIIKSNLQEGDKILTNRAMIEEIDGVLFPVPILIYLKTPLGHPFLEIELPYPFCVIFYCEEKDTFDIGKNSEFIYRIGDLP